MKNTNKVFFLAGLCKGAAKLNAQGSKSRQNQRDFTETDAVKKKDLKINKPSPLQKRCAGKI